MARRLVKVARELNVGTSTIVEHLNKRNFDIQNKPTAKVTDDMYNVLLKDFKNSIAIKKQANELTIGTRKRKEAALSHNEKERAAKKITVAVPKKEVPKKVVKKEPIKPKVTKVVEPVVNKVATPKVTKTPESTPPIKKESSRVETPKMRGPKILGKINLDARKKGRGGKTPTIKEEKLELKAKVTPPTKKEPKVQKPVDKPTAELKPKLDEKKAQKETKNVSKKTPVAKVKNEEKTARKKDQDTHTSKRKSKQKQEHKNRKNQQQENQSKSKKKLETPVNKVEKKSPPVVEAKKEPVIEKAPPPEEFRAETPKLKGLKILGKIDPLRLKKPPRKRKRRKGDEPDKNTSGDPNNRRKRPDNNTGKLDLKTKKPVASSDGKTDDPTKRKRTRKRVIRPVNRNNSQGSNSNTGNNNRSTSNNTSNNNNRGSNTGNNNNRSTSNNNNRGSNTGNNNNRSNTSRPSTNRSGGGNRPYGNRGGGNRRGPNRNAPKSNEPTEVSQKQIQDRLKSTMAILQGGGKRKRQRIRRGVRDKHREKLQEKEEQQAKKALQVTPITSVSELANLLDVGVTEVITTCMNMGIFVSINQQIDAEVIEFVAEEFGHKVEFISAEAILDVEEAEALDDPADLKPRSPIVTVMGHVDHGKTSLLDYIRKAKVADGEAGGITQHIGAYEVKVGEENKSITFLDTPGHEAFTAMRARGAKVTDVAIIIIAADDNIMPQTKEAISHAQAAGVPIIFAINKIDKPGANPENIKQQLASMNLLVESWGGKYQSADISAKTGEGIDDLLDSVILESEILELQANPNKHAVGAVLEASLDKGRGYVTKILVQAGTLKIGDPILAGPYSGKVKAMFNERNKRVKTAGPSTPVLVLGLGGAPQAGERFKATATEQEARQIATKREQIAREQQQRATKRISLEILRQRMLLDSFKELNLIVKGDMDGSVEALSDALLKQSIESIQINVIHKGVGQITETDIMLASASDAIIIGFQVRPSVVARRAAEREGVEIKLYSIIYDAIDQIRDAIEGMLEPTEEEKETASVEIRETYKISKIGTVAGCFVQNGKISRNDYIRIIREGIVVYPVKEGVKGELGSLRRHKDDMKEVTKGFECGITIKGFNNIKEGDIIEAYEIIKVKQKLGKK